MNMATCKKEQKGADVSCVLLCRLMVHSIVVGAFLALFLKDWKGRKGGGTIEN